MGRIQNVRNTAAMLKLTRYTCSLPNSSTVMVPAAAAVMANTPMGVRLTIRFVIRIRAWDAVVKTWRKASFFSMAIKAIPIRMLNSTTAGTTLFAME